MTAYQPLLYVLAGYAMALVSLVIPMWFAGPYFLLDPKAFVRGWVAEDCGVQRAQCPYLPDSIRRKAWLAGWDRSRETNP